MHTDAMLHRAWIGSASLGDLRGLGRRAQEDPVIRRRLLQRAEHQPMYHGIDRPGFVLARSADRLSALIDWSPAGGPISVIAVSSLVSAAQRQCTVRENLAEEFQVLLKRYNTPEDYCVRTSSRGVLLDVGTLGLALVTVLADRWACSERNEESDATITRLHGPLESSEQALVHECLSYWETI